MNQEQKDKISQVPFCDYVSGYWKSVTKMEQNMSILE